MCATRNLVSIGGLMFLLNGASVFPSGDRRGRPQEWTITLVSSTDPLGFVADGNARP
jgi:hypothetical protein